MSLRNADPVRLNPAVHGAVPELAGDRFGSAVGCFKKPRCVARLDVIT
jgi:hypothetical protein